MDTLFTDVEGVATTMVVAAVVAVVTLLPPSLLSEGKVKKEREERVQGKASNVHRAGIASELECERQRLRRQMVDSD